LFIAPTVNAISTITGNGRIDYYPIALFPIDYGFAYFFDDSRHFVQRDYGQFAGRAPPMKHEEITTIDVNCFDLHQGIDWSNLRYGNFLYFYGIWPMYSSCCHSSLHIISSFTLSVNIMLSLIPGLKATLSNLERNFIGRQYYNLESAVVT
jgi:hypothetical protein